MTQLLAIDPAAETTVSDTGWALFEVPDEAPAELMESGVIHGGFNGFCADTDFTTFLKNGPEIVVCEQYKVFNRAGDPSPMLIEGVVRYLRPDVVLQPSTGKNTLVSNEEMKHYGVYSTVGHHQDLRESVRHALVYLVKSKHLPTLRKLKA